MRGLFGTTFNSRARGRGGTMRLSRRFVFPFVLLIVVFFLPALCSAQSNATIRGTLTDPTGAAIPGAEIDVRSSGASSSTVHTQSGADGTFSVPMAAGAYRI